jgi:hypothetical protein
MVCGFLDILAAVVMRLLFYSLEAVLPQIVHGMIAQLIAEDCASA